MSKPTDFMYMVQTIILTNSINLATDPENNVRYRHVFSASGMMGLMGDVMWARDRIPDDMTAHQAAIEFTEFMLNNVRDIDEEGEGEKMTVPHWFARH